MRLYGYSAFVTAATCLIGTATANILDNVTSSFSLPSAAQIFLGPKGADNFAQERTTLLKSIAAELLERLSQNARLITAAESEFDLVNARYTDYRRPTYLAGVRAQAEQDVVETVNYARARGIPFVARAGGHSLTTSLRSIQDGIVIDMTGLNQVQYDPESKQITVGGGITTGEFANASHALGMEVTVGSCPCTGVLGISLGAGIGRLQGKYGFLHDNMVSIRMLLANGTIVRASKSEHADLFWAIRGAGHNFGIALEASYQLYPQQNKGNHYVVDFEYELDKVEALFDAVNEVADPLPPELAIFVIGRTMGATGGPTINLDLVYSGPQEDAQHFVKKFQALGPVDFSAKTSQWDALPWATYNGLNHVLCTRKGWSRFPVKNFYAANVKQYDVLTMRTFFDGWRDMNEKYRGQALFSFMFETFPQQAVQQLPDDETAFPWRKGANHFLMIEAAYSDPANEEAYDSWLSNMQDELIKTSGYDRLQQYVNYGHGSKDTPEALYGYDEWRLKKLRALKAEFDPEGWFNGYQPFV